MFKSPLIFGVALLTGWVLLASGAVASLAGVTPVANPPHVVVTDTIEVVIPVVEDIADASVPTANFAPPATKPAEPEATL